MLANPRVGICVGRDLQFETILVGGISHAWTTLIIIKTAPAGPGIPFPHKGTHARTLWGRGWSKFGASVASTGSSIQGTFRPATRLFSKAAEQHLLKLGF